MGKEWELLQRFYQEYLHILCWEETQANTAGLAWLEILQGLGQCCKHHLTQESPFWLLDALHYMTRWDINNIQECSSYRVLLVDRLIVATTDTWIWSNNIFTLSGWNYGCRMLHRPKMYNVHIFTTKFWSNRNRVCSVQFLCSIPLLWDYHRHHLCWRLSLPCLS